MDKPFRVNAAENATASTNYSYTPLDSSRREIRTIIIHPGEPSSPISCSLSIVSLNDRPVYDALSYVWGDVSEKRRITIDGAHLFITRNLHAVMLRLRCSPQTLTLWIDAICIYPDRSQIKHLPKRRLEPPFWEVFDSSHLACRIGKISSPCY